MVVDRALLRAKIIMRHTTIPDLCSFAGMSLPAFYRKLNGSSDFYREEIMRIRKFLHLTDDEIMLIFFPKDVPNTELSITDSTTLMRKRNM